MAYYSSDRNQLIAGIDAAQTLALRAPASGVRGLVTDSLLTARGAAAALPVDPPPPPPPSLPGALPMQAGSLAPMPTPGKYYTAVKLRTGSPSLATNSMERLAAGLWPRWGMEYAGNKMPATLTAFWEWVRQLGQEELGTATFFPGLSVMNVTSAYEGGNGARTTTPVQLGPNSFRVFSDPDPVQGWTGNFDVAVRSTRLPGRAISLEVTFKYGAASSVTPYVGLSFYTSNSFQPWYSVDGGANWSMSTAWSFNATNQALTVVGPTLGSTVSEYRLAEYPPYTLTQYAADLAAWEATGFVTKTKICDSVQGRPVYRVTVHASTGANQKGICMYRSGHEEERFATWRVRGMVDWACGPSTEAQDFRSRRDLHALIIQNPDCLANGWMRVTADGIQTNRWNPAGTISSTEGVEQAATRTDLATLTPKHLFMDHHTAYSTQVDALLYSSGSSATTALPLATYDTGNLISHTVSAENYSSSGWSYRRARADYSIPTIMWDSGGPTHANGAKTTIASAQAVGVAVLRAVDEYLVTH